MKVAVVLGTRPEIIKVMNALIVRFFSEVNMAKILVTGGLGYIDLTRPLNS